MRKSIFPVVLAAALALGANLGCGGKNAVAPPTPADIAAARALPDSVAAEASDLVAANTGFALGLYRRLAAGNDGNLFLSPFSISTAFAMTFAGARGQTEAEMAGVFGFPLDQERMHAVFGALLGSLDTGTGFDGYRLNLADRLFGQTGYGFLDGYLALTRERYGAELERLDFAGDPESSRTHINDWVESKTENRIVDLLPAGSITSATTLVLANAIYFKGNWKYRFDPAATRAAPFHLASGSDVTAPMMHQEGTFRFGYADGVQIVDLPYAGEDLSMLILLPRAADGLTALTGALTPQVLATWTAELREAEIEVDLPRFGMTSEFRLKPTLSAMGMPSAFGLGADFSGMNGTGGLFVSDAYHKAFVKVDEAGTEAAAATAVDVGRTSLPPQFRADHPFLFLIRDHVTGSVLFLGRVSDPTAQ